MEADTPVASYGVQGREQSPSWHGTCPEHPKRRKACLAGVNTAGYLFWCLWGQHYFVNLAPEPVRTT